MNNVVHLNLLKDKLKKKKKKSDKILFDLQYAPKTFRLNN